MRRVLLCSCALLLIACPVSFAQELSPEKRALITELIDVTELRKNADGIRNSISSQIEKDLSSSLNSIVLSDTKLTKEERDELIAKVLENAKLSRERFDKVFNERVNYAELIAEVTYEVYDDHYSVEELKDLLAFYKTPTGQKTVRILPQLFAESMAKVSERLLPKIQPLIDEMIAEETKRIGELLPKRPPQPTKRAGTTRRKRRP